MILMDLSEEMWKILGMFSNFWAFYDSSIFNRYTNLPMHNSRR